jgi:hypothetical protein
MNYRMDGQPRKFISIGLFGRSGFGLDAQGNIWFIQEVAPESPFGVGPWFKVTHYNSIKLAQ